MMNWCDKNNIDYIIGIARNSRLEELAAPLMTKAASEYEKDGEKNGCLMIFNMQQNHGNINAGLLSKQSIATEGKILDS